MDTLIKEQRAKKYAKTKQILSLTQSIGSFAIIVLVLLTGFSKTLENISYSYFSNEYLALLLFAVILFGGISVIFFPLDFYSGYIMEHKYELSNQTISGYFMESLKGLLLGVVLGGPLLCAFYYILKNFGDNWWLVLGIFLFVFSVIMGRLAPTLIMPLFYKFTPLENEAVKDRILNLAKKAGVTINGIFAFNMSKNTKKANAAFTGMGKSKRIILGDTLLENFNENEIETVFAHEMGHYTRKHILKLTFVSTILTFLGLFITAKLYSLTMGMFGFTSVYQLAALPLLFLWLSLYSLITSPITNILSRKFEWEADTYALEITKDKDAFISAMEKLADQNLAEKQPNKIIEFLFHSHPSLEKRIEFARGYNFSS
ncbi:MAG: M48 family metallopeptidase [Bacteroidetes bacterium]|nr:M48 family metallopeptidase [Bacteroidota bacterium]